jgi:protocatechuate 3,4-dioxygenase beta subunit
VHIHIIEPGRCTYYVDDVLFEDDPRLTAAQRRRPGRGGNGIVSPARDGSGGWLVTRDIVLGERIPGYPTRE